MKEREKDRVKEREKDRVKERVSNYRWLRYDRVPLFTIYGTLSNFRCQARVLVFSLASACLAIYVMV